MLHRLQSRSFPPDKPPSVNYRPFPDVFIPPYHYKNPVTGSENPILIGHGIHSVKPLGSFVIRGNIYRIMMVMLTSELWAGFSQKWHGRCRSGEFSKVDRAPHNKRDRFPKPSWIRRFRR